MSTGLSSRDFARGGHNAPPRGGGATSERGEPVYGPRDLPDLKVMRELGRPFWLAGSYASAEKLQEALALGARGVQIGTAFAFCEQSGLKNEFKVAAIRQSRAGLVDVLTDPRASPTGMPFKVLGIAGSLSEPAVYAARPRVCDLGYLRQAYRRPDGSVGYRCPAEPEEAFVAKGGEAWDSVGRKCLCNGLFAAIGLEQTIAGDATEPAIVTAGEDAADIHRFVASGKESYSAADVIRSLRR